MQIRALKNAIAGRVVQARDSDYDAVRRIFNGAIDRRPLLFAQCICTDDIRAALSFALENDLPLSVRGGGHNVGGSSICDEGVVIDLSLMTGVRVDPLQRLAAVGPGTRLRELDHETQEFGMATPVGIVSDTGVGGLALGGGLGWLMGRFGLTCDNLMSATVVLASGDVVVAGPEGSGDSDLLWALRGGSGNFGIVSKFHFQLHPVAGVIAGSLVYPLGNARAALLHFASVAEEFPDHLIASPALITARDGEKVLSIDLCYCSIDAAAADVALAPIRHLGRYQSDNIRPRPYVEWQRYLDDPFRAGRRSYWKSVNLKHLDAETITLLVEAYRGVRSPHTMLTLDHVHGEVQRVAPAATAFGSREWSYAFLINTSWEDPAEDEAHEEWTRQLHDEVSASSEVCGGYVNYFDSDDVLRPLSTSPLTPVVRLLELKGRYDPSNTFRHNPRNVSLGTP